MSRRRVQKTSCFPLHFWTGKKGRINRRKSPLFVQGMNLPLSRTPPLIPCLSHTRSDRRADNPRESKCVPSSPKIVLFPHAAFEALIGSIGSPCGFCLCYSPPLSMRTAHQFYTQVALVKNRLLFHCPYYTTQIARNQVQKINKHLHDSSCNPSIDLHEY